MTDNRPKLLISSSDSMMVTLEVSIQNMSSSTSGISAGLAKARRAQGRLQEAWATWRQSAGDAHFAAVMGPVHARHDEAALLTSLPLLHHILLSVDRTTTSLSCTLTDHLDQQHL